MRYALFSDVHSNLEALNAVLEEIQREKPDKILCLGDLIGYGPNPNKCVQRVREVADLVLAGNHDYASLGKANIFNFNYYARMAIEWTIKELSEDSQKYLAALPLMEEIGDFTLVHATPKDPAEWDYIMNLDDALENFGYFKGQLCFVGHSHIPVIIVQTDDNCWATREMEIRIEEGKRYIINIGSVGQPRDLDPRACYGVFDSERKTFQLKRVPYDINLTQEKMRQVGLPEFLIDRLGYGQ